MVQRLTISLLYKLLKSENLLAQSERASLIWYDCEVWLQNIGKYSPVKFANFVYFCITRENGLPHFNIVVFQREIQRHTEFEIYY